MQYSERAGMLTLVYLVFLAHTHTVTRGHANTEQENFAAIWLIL